MDKRVLFVAPRYFNYYSMIMEELSKKGHLVDFFEDITEGTTLSIFRKFNVSNKYSDLLLNKLLSYTEGKEYDILFVIGGKSLNFDQWRNFTNLRVFKKKLLYQWDSMKNFDYENLISLFDKTYTFDRNDSSVYRINYLPLFYQDNVAVNNENSDIDILFVGIYHSDRLRVLSSIYSQAVTNGMKCVFKVYYPFMTYFLLRLKYGTKLKSPFWIFKKISQTEMGNLYSRAKCILDISHPDQSGLTMRTIESVGAGKKLLTCNKNIKDESFYCPENIQIYSRENPVIDFGFIKKGVDYPNREMYSLSNWINTIFNY